MSNFEVEEMHPELAEQDIDRNCENCIFYECVIEPFKKEYGSMGVCNNTLNEEYDGTRPFAKSNDEPCWHHMTRKECNAIKEEALGKSKRTNALYDAAPELLSMLEGIVYSHDIKEWWYTQREKAIELIKKAKGED